MDSENEETLRERAQNLEKLVRGPLASSIEKLSNSVRNIPLETDFYFYNNFPHFKQRIVDLKNRSESLLRVVGTSHSLWKRPSSFPEDPDDAYEWVVNTQDDIFERLDVSMDEFRKEKKGCKPGGLDDLDSGFQLVYGNKKKSWNNKRELGVSKTVISRPESGSPGVKVVSRDKKTAGGRSTVPFHLPNISRPQDRYNIVVDNSNTPFKHRGLQKTEDGSKYIHPLEAELNKLEFADIQCEAPAPLEPNAWESTPFKFVERVQDLKKMAIKLQSASEIAVDLEHNQYRSYQGLTCLMQISTRLEDFVVDTLILHNHIGPCLKDIFSNTLIKKVMHGADRDILWLQCDFGIYVCNLFDTGQASRVLQLERNSLEFLLKHYCGITAEKEYQTADWRLRPLPAEMLKYARVDTHYLLYIHDIMWQKLASIPSESGEAPLLEVYRRSRDICLQLYEKERLTETSYLHIYGLQEENFSPEQLAAVAGLYEWRDGIARTEDESTGYILPNKVLLQIAKRMPNKIDTLWSFVKGRHSFVERNLAAVLDVIKQARESGKRATDIAIKLPLKGLANGTYEEMPQVGDQPPTVSVDTTAVNIVSYSQTYDDNCLSSDRLDIEAKPVCKNSVDVKMTDDRKSFFKEANRGETEFSEKVVSDAERQPSAVVGRAASSLLFNKKRDSVNGGQPISNDTKSNLVHLSLPSQERVSYEKCAVGNSVKGNGDAKQAEDFQVTIPADCSNSGDFILKEKSSSVQTSLESNFSAQEDCTVAKEPSVQAKRRPGRGLAAMLGSSKSKQKNETSSKMHDPEQDNTRNKVEKIKASITLPFQPFHRGCELTSIQHSPKSKEDLSNQDLTNESLQVDDEVGKVLCTETANPSVEIEIENAVPVLKKSVGIVHSDEGKKYRAWWPSVQFEGVGKASATTETNDMKLPPSLSELRQRQNYKHQSSCQLLKSANHEAHVNVNDFLHGKKRKSHSSEPSSASKVYSAVPETESRFKPFDYAAARQSMHFEMSDATKRNVKSYANKNLSHRKGKGSVHDPMSRSARESSGDDIQPGKRRQVFPASGNRSATFR